MKKMLKAMGLLTLMMVVGLVVSAFNKASESDSVPTDNAVSLNETEYSCTVTVYKKDGDQTWPYYYATVAGKNSDGFTKDFKTDKSGKAVLIWYSDSDLNAIYVDGKKFEGRYENGGSYTFYVDA